MYFLHRWYFDANIGLETEEFVYTTHYLYNINKSNQYHNLY